MFNGLPFACVNAKAFHLEKNSPIQLGKLNQVLFTAYLQTCFYNKILDTHSIDHITNFNHKTETNVV